jgi:hypothetical protein
MPPRNPLRRDNIPQEPTQGQDVPTNWIKHKYIRFISPDGTVREISTGTQEAHPDGQGNYIDLHTTNVVFDQAGNPLPKDPTNMVTSHTGLFIPSPEFRGLCTSMFHPPHRPKNIYIGQDGYQIGEGRFRCSCCHEIVITLRVFLGILAFGLLVGIYRGIGSF